jgi:nitrogenase molybdenum-cofactor synthesis protein NifE
MSDRIFQVSIGELGASSSHWQQKIAPPGCLHYCPPSAGGWGIIRVGLLVPDSIMLFVSPAGCGRHGAIAGIQLGFKKRLYFLHIQEMDIVTGSHMDKIPQAVDEILSGIKTVPKAILICATCIDDLLASDYDSLAHEMEAEHGIPVRICRMDPVAMDGKTPPPLTVQESIYSFLSPVKIKKKAGVNVIGNFAPINEDSEFYEVMGQAGIKEVRHIAACKSFDEFQNMSLSSHNLLLRPPGRLAVKWMEKLLGIPYCYAPVVYGLNTIKETYERIEEFLGCRLNTEDYFHEAETKIKLYGKELGGISLAVGSTANGGPFEIARALIEYGFSDVRYIFADLVLDFDAEHIAWLQRHAPNIQVFTNVHPSMKDFLTRNLSVDLAVGFDAGYFCCSSKTVPLMQDNQPYGYSGAVHLFEEMLRAMDNTQSHREQMYSAGLVI